MIIRHSLFACCAVVMLLIGMHSHAQGHKDVPPAGPVRPAAGGASNGNEKSAEPLPTLVRLVAEEKTQDEIEHERYERHEKPYLDRWLTYGTVLLAGVTGILAFFTFGLWNDARKTAKATGEDMRSSIAAAARAATAMERLAENGAATAANLKDVTAKQLRAYLTVNIGQAVYQESGKNLRFQARPQVINSGNTPAHKIKFKIRAGILPSTIPNNFDFPLPESFILAGVIGPRQDATMSAELDYFVLDAQASKIMRGMGADGAALHTWGVVVYEDVFGQEHVTKFFHAYTWLGPVGQAVTQGYFKQEYIEAT